MNDVSQMIAWVARSATQDEHRERQQEVQKYSMYVRCRAVADEAARMFVEDDYDDDEEKELLAALEAGKADDAWVRIRVARAACQRACQLAGREMFEQKVLQWQYSEDEIEPPWTKG